MRFYDEARIYVKAGDGGDGAVSFRREKFVPFGGPDGGNGGKGGDVILRADPSMGTLLDFRYRRHYRAKKGGHGRGKNMTGANAPDLVIRVPVGTLVKDTQGNLIADLVSPGQEVVVARGGRGGKGNAAFATATNLAPRVAEKGERGEEREILLELRLLADVGLIGLPNAGKSTLLARISAARPKIAPYPFTTLVPNLGVARVGEKSFVVADLPGLIAGAHRGVGLGHEFMRHALRTRVLVHVLDLTRDFLEDFKVVNQELALFDAELAKKPQVVAANKLDLEEARKNLPLLLEKLGSTYPVFPISALTGEGVEALLYGVSKFLPGEEA